MCKTCCDYILNEKRKSEDEIKTTAKTLLQHFSEINSIPISQSIESSDTHGNRNEREMNENSEIQIVNNNNHSTSSMSDFLLLNGKERSEECVKNCFN